MVERISNPEFVRAQLDKLLEQRSFRDSERHRHLLQFLVDTTLAGKSDELKEFVIAAEVWGRDVSFDPRIHSTVRVEVSRLRHRLDRHYADEGSADHLRFRIPVGGYAVAFEMSGIVSNSPLAPSSSSGTTNGDIHFPETAHFEILESLGRGGMGEIRKARDTRLNRFVALKFIPDTLAQDPFARVRFEVEARAAASINHPNICTVYDTGYLQGRPFFAMELLEGQTLRHRLHEGAIPVDTFLNWAVQITDGLDAAHTSGIVHRDLKPANLFVTVRDQAKILDFGLAKLRSLIPASNASGSDGIAVASTAQPDSTTIAGTLGYMSPEQARGEPVDSRSDLFALGAVFFEMLTGRPAFSELSAADIHRAVLVKNPPAPSTLNPSVPPELDRIVCKALEKDRDLRYQNAVDLRADLKRLKRDSDSHGSGLASAAGTPPPGVTLSARSTTKRWAINGICILVLCLVAGAIWFRNRKPKFTGNGNVVLAEFSNSTGDPVFDTALRQGLAAQLEQSPYLGVISDARISQTMKLMTQPKDARLTPDLARQVCQRTGSAASIEGSVASLGTQYVLGLRALNCKSGDILAQVQETADTKEQVLKALGIAASQLRQKLGESLPSLQKYDVPPENVTTGSLEALEAYGLGIQAQNRGDAAAAIPHFERAVALDPNFAMAYGHLGICLGSGDEGDAAHTKAYLLRDRVSDRERFYLVSHYEQYVTGDLNTARQTLETWAQTYPHDGDYGGNLLKLYLTTGEYEKALPIVQELIRNSPGTPVLNASRLASTLIYLNRVDEAKSVLQDAVAQHNAGPVHHYFLYEVAFMQSDAAAMEKEAAFVRAQDGWTNNMLQLESLSAAYLGQFVKSRELTDRAVENSKHAGELENAAGYLADVSLQEALAGNNEVAATKAKAALALSNNSAVSSLAGLALALIGDQADAVRAMNDLNKRLPKDTLAQVASATVRACGLLGDGKSPDGGRRAVEALAAASKYELSGQLYLVPLYVRAKALKAAGDTAGAAEAFQKILDHYGVTRNHITGSIAQLGLAEVEAQAGDKNKARADYAKFLALWYDADPDLPILKAAKASLASLGKS